MYKKIEIDLLFDGVEVSTLDEFRERFTGEVVQYFVDGRLAKWLQDRQLSEQLEEVETLTAEINAKIFEKLCNVFAVELVKPTKLSEGKSSDIIQVPAKAYAECTGGEFTESLLYQLAHPMLRNLQPLEFGQKLEGWLGDRGDSDYIHFEDRDFWFFLVESPGTVVVETVGWLSTHILLIDSSGKVIGEAKNSFFVEDFSGDDTDIELCRERLRIACSVGSGRYFISVGTYPLFEEHNKHSFDLHFRNIVRKNSGHRDTLRKYTLQVHCTPQGRDAGPLMEPTDPVFQMYQRGLGLGSGELTVVQLSLLLANLAIRRENSQE